MNPDLVLASTSRIRAQMLRSAGLVIECESPRVDEDAVRDSLLADEASPRDIADALAEAKARKVAGKRPDRRVLGCDQVLAFGGRLFVKPDTPEMARAQLLSLRGKTHQLLSAAVLYHSAKPVWRHVGVVRLTMRTFSEAYLDAYLQRTWPDISTAVGGYQIEGEGARLFSQIAGDYFTILGLPLLPLLNHLSSTGVIDS